MRVDCHLESDKCGELHAGEVVRILETRADAACIARVGETKALGWVTTKVADRSFSYAEAEEAVVKPKVADTKSFSSSAGAVAPNACHDGHVTTEPTKARGAASGAKGNAKNARSGSSGLGELFHRAAG